MDTNPQNLVFIGAALLFIGIMLPLILIASRGMRGSTYSRRAVRRTFRENTVQFLWASLGLLFVTPVVVLSVYNIIKLVVIGHMPVADFMKSAASYTVWPVVDLYAKIFSQTIALRK
ncbi:MAG: hypothetical protein HQL24_01955 [Candidatus Omnitrophica bacterium]|nr:hypothetical protein [Candidatus Omnitrophota bacterium]